MWRSDKFRYSLLSFTTFFIYIPQNCYAFLWNRIWEKYVYNLCSYEAFSFSFKFKLSHFNEVKAFSFSMKMNPSFSVWNMRSYSHQNIICALGHMDAFQKHCYVLIESIWLFALFIPQMLKMCWKCWHLHWWICFKVYITNEEIIEDREFDNCFWYLIITQPICFSSICSIFEF